MRTKVFFKLGIRVTRRQYTGCLLCVPEMLECLTNRPELWRLEIPICQKEAVIFNQKAHTCTAHVLLESFHVHTAFNFHRLFTVTNHHLHTFVSRHEPVHNPQPLVWRPTPAETLHQQQNLNARNNPYLNCTALEISTEEQQSLLH